MYIHEMSEAECRQALREASHGRLGCASDNHPYVVPIYFSFDGGHLYSFTTLGQKIEWMRSNPYVCLEIDKRYSHDDWMSVIVFGRYEELPDEPEFAAARAEAHELLQQRVMWWEPAYVGAMHRDQPHSVTPIFYRILIDRMTGRRATPNEVEPASSITEAKTEPPRWWTSLLRRMRAAN